MKLSRRNFLGASAGAGAFSMAGSVFAGAGEVTDRDLEDVATRPVLKLDAFKEPVIIESIELLKKGKEHFVRGPVQGRRGGNRRG